MSITESNDRAEVIALRQPCENLLRSTLTFMQDLRESGVVLPLHLRAQRYLVIVDGGTLDLAIDATWPDVTDPGATAARHLERVHLVERQLLPAQVFADPLVEDEPYDPRAAADRGASAIDALRAAPLDAEQMIDALDRHRVQGDDDLGAAA